MIIETDETINLSLMINNINKETQLMLNAMIESNQISIIKKKCYSFEFICKTTQL